MQFLKNHLLQTVRLDSQAKMNAINAILKQCTDPVITAIALKQLPKLKKKSFATICINRGTRVTKKNIFEIGEQLVSVIV